MFGRRDTMKRHTRYRRGFSLLELLVVIGIIALLVSIALPSLSSARKQSRSAVCLANLRTLGQGWTMYAQEHSDRLLPGRLPPFYEGGFGNPRNLYEVNTGMKYRPRWPVLMQSQVGVPALERPSTYRNRQNYDSEVYVCPSVSEWTDERNAAYGYNYQFLGNHRGRDGATRNWPLNMSRIRRPTATVVASDSNGSAASFPTGERLPYENADREVRRRGNYGWLLDPPRLTPQSSRAGGSGSPRSGPDPRHREEVNVVFVDDHAERMKLQMLGYDVESNGRILDSGLNAHNRLFSGTGEDEDPP